MNQCSPVSDNRLMYVAKYIVKSLGDFQNRPDYVKPFISCSRGLGLDTFIQNHVIYENLGSIKINGHNALTAGCYACRTHRELMSVMVMLLIFHIF